MVPSGFLYTYLASAEIGRPLILRIATGDSIPEIWPVYLNELPVPKVPTEIIEKIHTTVIAALEMRVSATKGEVKGRDLIERAILNI